MEWIESKSNDKEYLKKYYQNRIDHWKGQTGADKIVRHFEIALKKVQNRVVNTKIEGN